MRIFDAASSYFLGCDADAEPRWDADRALPHPARRKGAGLLRASASACP